MHTGLTIDEDQQSLSPQARAPTDDLPGLRDRAAAGLPAARERLSPLISHVFPATGRCLGLETCRHGGISAQFTGCCPEVLVRGWRGRLPEPRARLPAAHLIPGRGA